MAAQGIILWVPVEKLFMTQIGFDAGSVALMAAAYAAVVPLLQVPAGMVADRWSRNGILVVSSVALIASTLLGGLSTNIATYVIAAMILGVYFALESSAVDSIVYDTVLEETGSSDIYETWIGRVRIVQSGAFVVSALAGGVSPETACAGTSMPLRETALLKSASRLSEVEVVMQPRQSTMLVVVRTFRSARERRA